MKRILLSTLVLSIFAPTSGCTSHERVAAPPQSLQARLTTTQATPKIATAECDREMKCGAIGNALEFSTVEHCLRVKTDELSLDFNSDRDCQNGIPVNDLDECVARTSQQTCGGLSGMVSNAERASQCGSGDLCLD